MGHLIYMTYCSVQLSRLVGIATDITVLGLWTCGDRQPLLLPQGVMNFCLHLQFHMQCLEECTIHSVIMEVWYIIPLLDVRWGLRQPRPLCGSWFSIQAKLSVEGLCVWLASKIRPLRGSCCLSNSILSKADLQGLQISPKSYLGC